MYNKTCIEIKKTQHIAYVATQCKGSKMTQIVHKLQ